MKYQLPANKNQVDKAAVEGRYLLTIQVKLGIGSQSVYSIHGEIGHDALFFPDYVKQGAWPKGLKHVPIALFVNKEPQPIDIKLLTHEGAAVVMYKRGKFHHLNNVNAPVLRSAFQDRYIRG